MTPSDTFSAYLLENETRSGNEMKSSLCNNCFVAERRTTRNREDHPNFSVTIAENAQGALLRSGGFTTRARPVRAASSACVGNVVSPRGASTTTSTGSASSAPKYRKLLFLEESDSTRGCYFDDGLFGNWIVGIDVGFCPTCWYSKNVLYCDVYCV